MNTNQTDENIECVYQYFQPVLISIKDTGHMRIRKAVKANNK